MVQSFKRHHILEKAEMMKPSNEGHPSVETYLQTMRRIQRDGAAFVAVELDRIERLLQGAIHSDKSDELQIRKNILQQFAKLHLEKDEL